MQPATRSHQGQEIKALCLRAGCDKASAQCFICEKELHQGCQSYMKMCKDVPQLVIPLQSIRSQLIEFKQNMNSKMDNFINLIEETLMPIDQYSENPNLTNLNKLGSFLKLELGEMAKKQIEKVEEEIKSLFQQYKGNILKQYPIRIDYEGLEKKIQEFIQDDKMEETLKIVEAALKQNKNDKMLLLNKGLILYQYDRYLEVIDCFDQAIKIDPNLIQAWNSKGCSLCKLQRYQEAIKCYDQVIKIDANFISAWNGKGYSLDQLKSYQEAINCYDQAIKINPRSVLAWNNKGMALYSQKRNQEAINCYDQVIAIEPKYYVALNNIGASLNDLTRYQEAIKYLDQGIQINPNFHNFYKNKGYSLIGLKRYQEAIEQFEYALKLNQNYEDAITGLKIAQNELLKLKN